MTAAECNRAIKSAVEGTPAQLPITLEFCRAVRDALRGLVPEKTKIEVFQRPGVLLVELRVPNCEPHLWSLDVG